MQKEREGDGPGAAATATRTGFVALGKPTPRSTAAVRHHQSETRDWTQLTCFSPVNTGKEQPEARA